MQIDYYSPSSFETKVDQLEGGQDPLLRLTPQFYKGSPKQNAGYFVVRHDEKETRYLLLIGNDGKLQLKPLNEDEEKCPKPQPSQTQTPSAGGNTSGQSPGPSAKP